MLLLKSKRGPIIKKEKKRIRIIGGGVIHVPVQMQFSCFPSDQNWKCTRAEEKKKLQAKLFITVRPQMLLLIKLHQIFSDKQVQT